MTVDPEDFIITRKRKKYKFALFANSPLCFELDEWDAVWSPDVVEVGAGTGQFIVELAQRHPERRYVAIDVKADRLQKGARQAEALGLTNVRFLRARADQLVDTFQPNSLLRIWLTFPDPHPKKRSAGRRLTNPTFLKQYQTLLVSGGDVSFKHDDADFFQWSLEQFVAEGWHIAELTFNLHESVMSDECKLMTVYEKRWVHEGKHIMYVKELNV